MAISVFPAGGGEFVTNDFVVDMNDTANNVIDLGRTYAVGSYNITLASGDSTFDIYALDADGASVGYTNDASLVVSAAFTQLVILGVSQSEVITFAFAGSANNATGEGTATGAGAYLEGISPFDLPTVDDTATVTGGNFATDVEIYFESGTVSTAAKSVTRNDTTELIVTRPDVLDPALDPWDVKAINPGITPPTGSNIHILAGTVDAGAVPVFTTTSPLTSGTVDQAYAATVVATDADGAVTYSVTAGSLPTGLALNSATGVISGTPTTGSELFTIQALDDGGNSNEREFELPVLFAEGGIITTDSGFTYHTFNSSSNFEIYASSLDVEYAVIAAGGGGGSNFENGAGAGGGAGGFLEGTATLSAGTLAVGIGAGGNLDNTGGNSNLGNFTATGGGDGGSSNNSTKNGADGGSGGGGAGPFLNGAGGSGIAGQGHDGAPGNVSGNSNSGGGGGGAGSASNSTSGGSGKTAFIFGTKARGASGNNTNGNAGDNTGDGGQSSNGNNGQGGSGVVFVRYAS